MIVSQFIISTSMLRTSGPRAVVREGEVRLGVTTFRGYAARGRAP